MINSQSIYTIRLNLNLPTAAPYLYKIMTETVGEEVNLTLKMLLK